MRILLLTSLYPDEVIRNPARQTPAIHNFVKFWNNSSDVQVKVIKLHYFPIDEKSYVAKPGYIRDGVPVESEYIFDKGVFKNRFKNFKFFKLWLSEKLETNYLEEFNLKNLIRTIEKESFSPDIILAHGMLSFKETHLVSMHLKLPYILGFHASDIKNLLTNSWWENYIRKYSGGANGLVARSKSIESKIKQNLPKHTHLFTAISGIKPEFLIPVNAAIQKLESWKSAKRPVKFISVCTLIKLKNIHLNLQALSNLSSEVDYEYTIVGEGAEFSKLKELTKKLELESKVKFRGQLSHIETLKELENSDIFIMVSSPETFGLSYLEALSKGNLLIGARDNGIDGLFQDRTEAFFVTPEIHHIENCLREILLKKNKQELILILTRSMQRLNSMSEQKVALNYLKYIEEVLND